MIESEVFMPGSRVWRLAAAMHWRFQHALGVCASLWHSSQAAELSQASSDEVLTFCGPLSKSERTRLLEALEQCAIVSRLENGDFEIRGNEHHITAKKVNSIAQRNRALERWKKLGVVDADGIKNEYRRHAGDHASAVQSGSVQSSAERSSAELFPQTPAQAPLALAEEAHKEQEARSEIQPPPKAPPPPLPPQTNSLREITVAQVPPEIAKKLVELHRAEVSKPGRDLVPPPLILPVEMNSAREIFVLAGGSEVIAANAIKAYVRHNGNDFWKKQRWPLSLLARQRDFEQAIQIASSPKKG